MNDEFCASFKTTITNKLRSKSAANSSFKLMQKESAALELNLRLKPTK